MSEYGSYEELVIELRKTQQEYAEALVRHGRFIAELTWAAFGHTDQLTHEQITESLKTLRKEWINYQADARDDQ